MSLIAAKLTSCLTLNNVLESEWQSEVFLPFFVAHEKLICDYVNICSNPNLLLYLLARKGLKAKLNWSKLSANKGLTIDIINQYPDEDWNWYDVSSNPGITMQDIINHPEYPWDWDLVFANPFIKEKSTYVNNQLGRVLLVSMLDEFNNDTSTPLDNTLLVFYNDYHLSCVLPYI